MQCLFSWCCCLSRCRETVYRQSIIPFCLSSPKAYRPKTHNDSFVTFAVTFSRRLPPTIGAMVTTTNSGRAGRCDANRRWPRQNRRQHPPPFGGKMSCSAWAVALAWPIRRKMPSGTARRSRWPQVLGATASCSRRTTAQRRCACRAVRSDVPLNAQGAVRQEDGGWLTDSRRHLLI